MLPTLPQNDPDPAARHAQLARSRTVYRFTHKYSRSSNRGGIGVAAAVPPEQEFTPDYLLKVVQVNATLLANHAALDLEYVTGSSGKGFSLTDWLGLTRLVGNKHLLFSAPLKAASRIARSFPPNLAAYEDLYAVIAKPEVIYKLKQGSDIADQVFAWQRLAGASPLHIQGITEIPAAFKKALKKKRGDRYLTTLEAAAAEGRLYIADYVLLEDLPHGTYDSGELNVPRYKYIFAPIALFVWQKETSRDLGRFMPVAIQCDQSSNSTFGCPHTYPIFTPEDGVRWEMAKATVQAADGNLQEMVYHLGYTHLVMEAVIVAAERHLAAVHPLYVLLKPHFQFTLALNDYAYKHLIAPNGAVDQVLGSTLEGSLTLLLRGMAEYCFSQAAPPHNFKNRHVDDLIGLPDYPYRDDALLVWEAIHRFVAHYIRLYYTSDSDVVSDQELLTWITSIGARDGGNIRGIEPITTLAQLIETIALIVFTASAQHGALNYAQFPMMSYIPNVSGGMYAEAPTESTPENEENFLMLLAPMQQAMMQFDIVYQLSSVRYGKLGYYPRCYFEDARVPPLVAEFQQQLAMVEAEICDRDTTRFMSYPFLRPSELGNSIFI